MRLYDEVWTLSVCGEWGMARHYAARLRDTVHQHGMSTWIFLAEHYCAVLDAPSKSGNPMTPSASSTMSSRKARRGGACPSSCDGRESRNFLAGGEGA